MQKAVPATSSDAFLEPEEPKLPGKAQQNLDVLQRFQDMDTVETSRLQLLIEKASTFFGTPLYFLGVTAFVLVWIAVNVWGLHHGWPHYDEPPFFWLQGLVSFNALVLTVAVLIRQNRMAVLAQHRAHLDLQINLLTEQKVSKILALLDEIRPAHRAQDDPEATELAKPADPKAMLQAIKKATEQGPAA